MNAASKQISAMNKNEVAMSPLSFPSIAERITTAGGGQVEFADSPNGSGAHRAQLSLYPLGGSIFAISSAVCPMRARRCPSPAGSVSDVSGWNRGRTPYRSPVSAQYPAETRGFFESHVVRGYTLNAPRRGRSDIPAPVCFAITRQWEATA